jgi:hypothetical protein
MPGSLAEGLRGEHPEGLRAEDARATEGRSEVDAVVHLDLLPDRIEFYSEHMRPGIFRDGVRLNPQEPFTHGF